MPPMADNASTTARFLISQLRSRRSHHSSGETTRALALLGFTSKRSTATSILRGANRFSTSRRWRAVSQEWPSRRQFHCRIHVREYRIDSADNSFR